MYANFLIVLTPKIRLLYEKKTYLQYTHLGFSLKFLVHFTPFSPTSRGMDCKCHYSHVWFAFLLSQNNS